MLTIKGWFLKTLPMLLVMGFLFSTIHYINLLKRDVQEADREKVTAQMETERITSVVEGQSESIQGLLDLRERDSATLLSLASRFSLIEQEMGQLSRLRVELEKVNAEVKEYLDTPIPLELRSLYNGSKAAAAKVDSGNKGGKGQAKSGTASGAK